MSSPFAVFLKNLRLRSSQRQHELAKLLGYEQAYISSIELGLKKPSQELLTKLTSTLMLSEQDQVAMQDAASQSKRRFILPVEVPTETYHLCNELWAKIDQLYPAQIRAIRELIKIDDQIADMPRYSTRRIHRKDKEEPKM